MSTWVVVLICIIGGIIMLLGLGALAALIFIVAFTKSGGDIHCDIDLRKEEDSEG